MLGQSFCLRKMSVIVHNIVVQVKNVLTGTLPRFCHLHIIRFNNMNIYFMISVVNLKSLFLNFISNKHSFTSY